MKIFVNSSKRKFEEKIFAKNNFLVDNIRNNLYSFVFTRVFLKDLPHKREDPQFTLEPL